MPNKKSHLDMLPDQKSHIYFTVYILLLLGISVIIRPYPVATAWFGFFIAAYAAIANDSIQTIGTFISSNHRQPWWYLWIYLGGIFFVTVLYSWLYYGGDVSHERLIAKGFEEAPTTFAYLQILAPIILLILTHLKTPVSTTFLLLGSFAASSNAIGKVLFKSLSGYFLSFFIALIFFTVVARISQRYFTGTASKGWVATQWLVSGLLWSVWLQQDLANIAVFLPRSLSPAYFSVFTLTIVVGLGILLYLRGGLIQQVVTEKSQVDDPRFVTLIDGVYACILYFFKLQSKIPMSTTWVFLGLLAGRELGMLIARSSPQKPMTIGYLILKDVSKALFGLIVSIWVATSVNPNIELDEIYNSLSKQSYALYEKLSG